MTFAELSEGPGIPADSGAVSLAFESRPPRRCRQDLAGLATRIRSSPRMDFASRRPVVVESRPPARNPNHIASYGASQSPGAISGAIREGTQDGLAEAARAQR